MATKTYTVIKDSSLINAFYPIGPEIVTEEVIASWYITAGILEEKPEEPQAQEENEQEETEVVSSNEDENLEGPTAENALEKDENIK